MKSDLVKTILLRRSITSGHFKKKYGKKLWNQWGTRLFYWQGAIFTSTGGTILVMFLLKWANVVALYRAPKFSANA